VELFSVYRVAGAFTTSGPVARDFGDVDRGYVVSTDYLLFIIVQLPLFQRLDTA